MRVLSSAYGPPWEGIQGTGITATGIDLRKAPHLYIVAVDPKHIPLHSKLVITPNPYGVIAIFRAEDTGSAIKGARIDFYMWEGQAAARKWGMRWVDVAISGKSDDPVKPAPVSTGPGAFPTRPTFEPGPRGGAPTNYDYSSLVRATRINVARGGAFLRDAGDAIRRAAR